MSARGPEPPPRRQRREPVGPWGNYVNDVLVRKGLSYRKAYEAINRPAHDDGERSVTYGRHTIRNWIGGVIPHADALQWIATAWDEPVEKVSAEAEAQRAWRYEQRIDAIRAAPVLSPYLGLSPVPGAGLTLTGPPALAARELVAAPWPGVPWTDGLVLHAGSAEGWLASRWGLARSQAGLLGPDAAGAGLAPTGDEDDDVERRLLLKLIGGALALPVTGSLEHLRRSVDRALTPAATGHEIEEWERLADEYSRMVFQVAPAHFLPDLLTDLDDVRARLATSSDDLRPRLVRVCALLSALTAITLGAQAGDTINAARYWRTALRAVDQAGDRSLQALLRGRRAVFALYDLRQAASVLALADDAIGVAGGRPCAGSASAYAARAQALAELGQHDEARDAVRDLSNVFSRLPDAVRTDELSVWGWAEQRLRFVESHVHSHAGRLGDAVTAQDSALALYPPSSNRVAPAQVELHRATCLIVTGDPSEGARHTIRTIQALPPAQRHAAIVRRTAIHALDLVPEGARSLPAVVEARDLLALPSIAG